MKKMLIRSHMIKGLIALHVVLIYTAIFNTVNANSFDLIHHYQQSQTIKSVKELRNEQLIRQHYDFNCAAASLATLLNYQYGERYTELGITNALLVSVKPKKRAAARQNGFSLHHIQKVSKALGYKMASYNMDTLDELKAFNFPSMVRLVINDIPHFVVVTHIDNGRVFIADPAWGNRSMTYYQFMKKWERRYAVFILPKDKKLGDKTLTNAFKNKTPTAADTHHHEQTPPDVWLQQDFDKFIVNIAPFPVTLTNPVTLTK